MPGRPMVRNGPGGTVRSRVPAGSQFRGCGAVRGVPTLASVNDQAATRVRVRMTVDGVEHEHEVEPRLLLVPSAKPGLARFYGGM